MELAPDAPRALIDPPFLLFLSSFLSFEGFCFLGFLGLAGFCFLSDGFDFDPPPLPELLLFEVDLLLRDSDGEWFPDLPFDFDGLFLLGVCGGEGLASGEILIGLGLAPVFGVSDDSASDGLSVWFFMSLGSRGVVTMLFIGVGLG